jgi:hypothetical protein
MLSVSQTPNFFILPIENVEETQSAGGKINETREEVSYLYHDDHVRLNGVNDIPAVGSMERSIPTRWKVARTSLCGRHGVGHRCQSR